MGKVSAELHSLMLRGGFRYDAKKDKYFMAGEAGLDMFNHAELILWCRCCAEAEWDKQKRIDKGKKQ